MIHPKRLLHHLPVQFFIIGDSVIGIDVDMGMAPVAGLVFNGADQGPANAPAPEFWRDVKARKPWRHRMAGLKLLLRTSAKPRASSG